MILFMKLISWCKILIVCMAALLVGQTTAAAEEIQSALVDGTSIMTGNEIASVWVRAKSLSLGYCATEIATNGSTASVLAPPQFWSDWTRLVNHIGHATFTINTKIHCDTGALFQIRYYN